MEARIILDLDLTKLGPGELRLEPERWDPSHAGLARVGSWGGSALAAGILHREASAGSEGALRPAPLVLAAGDAVLRQLPTAARLSVLSRGPLSGRLAEGHIGGDLGPNLAGLVDALVLRGRCQLPTAVLFLDAQGGARLESRPELAGLGPVAVWSALREFGATLCVGLGGELGLAYSLLAGGSQEPSMSGRGGLGAVFGSLGLKALVIAPQEAPRSLPMEQRAGDLQRALSSSPRLAARAAGGSLELFERPDAAGLDQGLAREAEQRAVERKGCRGCPTPCGWIFERASGKRQRGHFNANQALGSKLGLDSFDSSLALLARCDEYAVDAREVGAMLTLLIQHEERQGAHTLHGQEAALLAAIDGIVGRGERPLGLEPEVFRRGSLGLAKHLGLDAGGAHLQGQAIRADVGQAALLGQAVSCGGADPMRSFPFLVDALGRTGLERVCRDLAPLPEGAEDPSSSVAKGRLVAWHEDLVAIVDALGFCVFSSAGLLADGVSDVGQLAAWLLPEELLASCPASWAELELDRRFLAAGSNIVELRRSLDRRYRAQGAQQALSEQGEADQPASSGWDSGALQARLQEPGMLGEYLACRRDDDDLAALAEPLARRAPATPSRAPREPAAPGERQPGSVELQATGPLGRALGAGALQVRLPLPASLSEVLLAACQEHPALERQLFMGPLEDRIPLPSAWRSGRRLPEGGWIEAGDELVLVSVIAGG